MFEESLLESAHLIRTQSRWPAFASFGLQAAIAAIIVIVPILHPEVVPLHAKLLVITAPPLPTQPPTPPPPQRVHVEMSSSTSPSIPEPAQPTMATQNRRINPTQFTDEAPPDNNGSITGTSMTSNTNPLASLAPSGTSGSPNIVVAGPVKTERTKVSTGVSAGLLLHPIQPIYPPIAKAAHVEGIVTVHAIISKTGTIESASAIGGPIMLQQAALDAIRTARYRPYLLNGLPTEVDTTFSVVFHLSS